MNSTPTRFEDEFPEAAEALMWAYKPSTVMDGIRNYRFMRRSFPMRDFNALPERNAGCDCGSGLKTKKCCALIPKVANFNAWSLRVTGLNDKAVDVYIAVP